VFVRLARAESFRFTIVNLMIIGLAIAIFAQL
jgi:hypothetical protein